MNKVINISSNEIKQAIDDLVNENELLQDKIYKQNEEIERLNNIINELEKWLIKQQIEEGEYCDFLLENKQIKVEEVLDKIKELKGSDKE